MGNLHVELKIFILCNEITKFLTFSIAFPKRLKLILMHSLTNVVISTLSRFGVKNSLFSIPI